MSTLNEITYNILNTMAGGGSTNDAPYSPRQIQYMVRYYRNLLIRRDTDYFKRLSDLEQDLGLLAVSAVQEPVGKVHETPRTVLRTNEEIPEQVHLRKRSPFTHIGSPDLQEHYDLMPTGQLRYQNHSKYTSSTPRAYLHDGHIYIHSDAVATLIQQLQSGDVAIDDTSVENFTDGITTIRVKGVFSYPEEAYLLAHGEPYDPDTEYPGMPEDMVQRITQSILSGEVQTMIQVPTDTEADHLPVNAEPPDNEAG
jgi:hypothetical protein